MKNSTTGVPPSYSTGVLLPPYPSTGVGSPAYYCVGDIIEDIWESITELETEVILNYTPEKEIEMEYMYNLIEYWEEVYLLLYGKRYSIQFL